MILKAHELIAPMRANQITRITKRMRIGICLKIIQYVTQQFIYLRWTLSQYLKVVEVLSLQDYIKTKQSLISLINSAFGIFKFKMVWKKNFWQDCNGKCKRNFFLNISPLFHTYESDQMGNLKCKFSFSSTLMLLIIILNAFVILKTCLIYLQSAVYL